jgi:predicted nucleic acid-binding protein
MVLVDTSVWISHLGDGHPVMEKLLMDEEVACHPYVIGELACGNLKNRDEILTLLQSLPQTVMAEPDEVLEFIDNRQLMGMGLGYIDFHLIVSSLLSDIPLWTWDKSLLTVCRTLGISYPIRLTNP